MLKKTIIGLAAAACLAIGTAGGAAFADTSGGNPPSVSPCAEGTHWSTHQKECVPNHTKPATPPKCHCDDQHHAVFIRRLHKWVCVPNLPTVTPTPTPTDTVPVPTPTVTVTPPTTDTPPVDDAPPAAPVHDTPQFTG
jgi:hypothetical protein